MRIKPSDEGNLINIRLEGLNLPKRVFIYDCTLRDGEQTPGVALTIKEKLTIAKQLAKLGVDTIEAGTPINSKDEKEAVYRIAKEIEGPTIAALARVLKPDIDACLDCQVDLIHVFVSTSDIHLKYQMKKTREEIMNMALEAVEYVKAHGVKCLFSAMDATRTELGYLIQVLKEAEKAGADSVNVPDTVGVMTPSSMRSLISDVRKNISVILDVHCHNDFGLAVANTIAGVEAGADEVQVTVNGIGERAGNAALEPVVIALSACYGIQMNIKPQYLMETSSLVEQYTGVPLSPCTPIVGRNAFAHESGIHVHPVLIKASTFEPISPEDVGQRRRIVLGKKSGRHSVKAALEELGIKDVGEKDLIEITTRIKDLAAKNKLVSDVDLVAIAEDVLSLKLYEPRVKLQELVVVTGVNVTPSATVKLLIDGVERIGQGIGVGPVDAAAKAIEEIVGPISRLKLKEFNLRALTGGTDSLASVTMTVEDALGNQFEAGAVHGDIVTSSVNALINALNKALHYQRLRGLEKGSKDLGHQE
ncbi:2-isopropylmalate synthase [Candidatus Bathyarchaeota archaeon]|nr:2-isopropylmalate synthase [Candidatus Bathyarchaeota archaeon]MBS7627882.1 2-isopropylmalate synthase [Candidatus Bathyarchaeota archaeon]